MFSMSLHFRRPRAVSVDAVKGLRQPDNRLTKNSRPSISIRCTVYCALIGEIWCHQLVGRVAHGPSSQSDPRAFELEKKNPASRAPAAIACETEHSSRHLQEGSRGTCSDPLDPGGEARGWSVACTIGTLAPLVLIIAAGRYIGFLELIFFFQAGVLWVRRATGFSGVLIGTKLLFCFHSTAHRTPWLPAERSRSSRRRLARISIRRVF